MPLLLLVINFIDIIVLFMLVSGFFFLLLIYTTDLPYGNQFLLCPQDNCKLVVGFLAC